MDVIRHLYPPALESINVITRLCSKWIIVQFKNIVCAKPGIIH